MIQSNNHISVVPFFSGVDYQHHRKTCAWGNKWNIYCPKNRFLPFQIFETNDDGLYTLPDISNIVVSVYKADGELVIEDWRESLVGAGLFIHDWGDKTWSIVFQSRFPTIEEIPLGFCFIKLHDATNNLDYYSEMLTIVEGERGMTKIEWWDLENAEYDMGHYYYGNGEPFFHNRMYLVDDIGKPEYKYEEEGSTRNGKFFPTKQVRYKIFKMYPIFQEAQIDALSMAWMADICKVTDKLGNVYLADTFDLDESWNDEGDLAKMKIQFTTNTVCKKSSRKWIADYNKGDFNKDFNTDFFNKD